MDNLVENDIFQQEDKMLVLNKLTYDHPIPQYTKVSLVCIPDEQKRDSYRLIYTSKWN